MQCAQHETEYSCMSDNRHAVAFSLCSRRQKLHFIQYPPLKVAEAFSVRCRQARIFGNPAASIGLISLFNLFPGKAFPLTKVDLTQCGTHMTVDVKCLGNDLSGCPGSPQVTCVHHPNVLRTKSIDKLSELGSATRVQFRIGVTAKGSGHIRLRMTNKKYLAHTIHTPQK
jgi:hypothetical protein